MKCIRILQGLTGLLALATVASAQTSTGFAPSNFGNIILTSTPSNATGASGVSTVYTSSGSQFTFGTGGTLNNPAQFNYVVTGPNTATISEPASGSTPATTTNLVFTGANSGTYTTVQGTNTTTGRFGLASIPASAPIENVSSRSTLTTNGSTTVGFVIAGSMPRRVLIRAVGPGLAAFGVTNAITNPSLNLYRGNQLLATNDDWGTLQALSSGTGTGGTSSGGTSTGSGSGTSTGSTSGGTSTGTGSTSGGTSTGGTTTGTSSGFFSGTLANGSTFTTQMASASDFTQVGAFALQQGSRDAAFVVTLPPGAYTVIVRNSATAIAAASSSTGTSSGGTSSGSTSGGTSSGSTSGTSSGSTSGGTSSGTTSGSSSGSTSGGTSTGTTSGTSTGSTSGGTSTGTGSGTSTGSTSGGTSTGTGSGTSTGSTSGGSTGGGTGTGTGTTASGGTGGTGSAATATTTNGDVLVEVYFLE